ncbi:MAG TPA: ComEC/Rec2 family competence protein [Lacisediminihabitans sp.]|uniref:ComEC/Rec2 family competence protein n=1 Tax=Lacisediminihabitans sp. TaxID=2787631 RepID=UPI002ED9E87B
MSGRDARPDLRLAVPAAVGWAAVAGLLAVPAALAPVAVASWAATIGAGLIAGLFVRRRSLLIGISLCLAAVAMLTTIAASREPDRRPDALIEAAGSGRFVTLSATIAEPFGPDADSYRITLTEARIGSEVLWLRVPALAFGAVPHGSPGIGTGIRLGGRLSVTEPEDDVGFLVFVRGSPAVVRSPPWYLGWADGLRSGFRHAASTLPGDGGGLLPGLAIGDTAAVDEGLDEAMKATSLSHLTAVSGANCAVIIALVLLVGGLLGLSRGWRMAVSLAVLLGFVVLVTPQPSVLRAAAMATLVLVATFGGRPARGLPVLALTVLVLLAADPWLARSYGFVLSVLATAGLLVLSRPVASLFGRWLPSWLATALAIPVAAQVACQPVLILLNPAIPTFGVVANVLAEPAAPIATVLGLVACLLVGPFPALGGLVAHVAWLPAAWIAAVARLFGGLPGGAIPWPGGTLGVLLLAVGTALAGLVAFRRSRARLPAAAALCLLLVVQLGIVGGQRLGGVLSRPADWQIAACDIGQGDAVLVRSLGRVALIDTGPDPELLAGCLRTLGIDRIDLLILSHYDLDHVGGTSAVFGRVDRAMVGPPSDPGDESLARRLGDSGALVERVSRGLSGGLGELRWEVLWPKARLGGVEPGNDASVTVRFGGAGACAAGCLSALFLGDLGDRPQTMMMAANRLTHVDVVKVAHHGSADQDERLYRTISATVGLISVGLDNDYGHPTDRLLTILREAGTTVARTDREGMVLISPRPDGSVSVWRERPPADGDGGTG